MGSNALNAFVGNQPTDVITHNSWAPTRKIDPATANAVSGGWTPRSTNSSGTWDLGDIRSECGRRAGSGPGPTPTPPTQEVEMIPASIWIPGDDPDHDRTDQFVIGASDKALYHRTFTFSDGWTEWECLGGQYLGSPSVTVRDSDKRIDVYAQGMDGQVWQTQFTWTDGWTSPMRAGGWPG
jgi:hypothetical protein